MARRSGETIADLFISLGLDLSQLESDFIAADRSANEAMARLRRQTQLINLRAQVELEGLDEATDGARRLEIQEQALNEQLTVQRDRLRITQAALQQLQQSRNQDRAAVQRAEIALERERLAMAQLERQMRRLHDEQEDITETTEGMPDAMSRARGAIEAVIGTIVSASAAINGLISRFDEMQLKAYELHASFADTREYLRQLKLAGAESDDLMGFIRGIDDALVKGDVDDPETMALKKYGVNLFDETGRLKDYTEQLELLYEGYKRAKEAGEEVEYLLMLNGESIHEILPLFERWEESKSDAAKIEDSGLNVSEMHEASREMALLKEQTVQFGEALVSAAMPTARSVLNSMFETFRAGTEYIRDNRREIQLWLASWAERDAVIPSVIDQYWQQLKNPHSGRIPQYDAFGYADELAESNLEQYEEGLQETEYATRELEAQTKKLGDALSYAWRDSIVRAKEFREELEDLQIELEYGDNEYAKSRAELEQWLERETHGLHAFTEEQEQATRELLSRDDLPDEQRIELTELLANKMKMTTEELTAIRELYAAKSEQIEQERADKLDEIREEIAAGDRTALENKLAAIEKESEAWRAAGMSEAEIVELAQRRINQVREEAMQKARDLARSTAEIEYSLTHEALEKQIYDVEQWKQAQMEKAETAEEVAAIIANAAMREAEAFEREMDRIRGKIESGQDQLARLTLSQYDNDVRNAYKQFQKNIEDQMPQDLAQAIFDATMRQIKRRARDDTTGKYRESPDKPDDGPVLIDFKRRVEDQNKMLLDMDSRQWAMQETMARAAEISSDTVNQAMAKVKEIEAQRERPPEPSTKKSKVMYGDDYDNTSYNKHGGGVILNFEKLSQTTDKLSQTTDKATSVLDGATANVENVFEGLKTSTANADEALSALSTTTTEVNQSISELTIDAALDELTGKFEQTADIFAGINEKLSQMNFTPPEAPGQEGGLLDKIDVLKKGMETTALGGELAALAGVIRGDPRLALIGATVQAASNSGLFVKDTVDDLSGSQDDSKGVGGTVLTAAIEPLTQEIRTLTQDVSSRLTEITQMAGEIAANTKQAPQQNITVSPSINIDLGGAYVFDDAMKQQLTDDITRDVANAVTDAVKKATDKTDYSYGR